MPTASFSSSLFLCLIWFTWLVVWEICWLGQLSRGHFTRCNVPMAGLLEFFYILQRNSDAVSLVSFCVGGRCLTLVKISVYLPTLSANELALGATKMACQVGVAVCAFLLVDPYPTHLNIMGFRWKPFKLKNENEMKMS